MHPIIELFGGVALLLWGTYMVRTGMLRTFGLALRDILSKKLKNRVNGFVAGFTLSSLLQSSTAATLLVAGLQAEGVVTTAISLSAIMGAELGSAFVARVLSYDLSIVAPLLVLSGVFLFFFKHATTRSGQFGRILLGLGLVMMALSQIIASTQPLRQSTDLAGFFEVVGSFPLFSLVLGTVLAMGCFSSLAAVIIVQGLVTASVLSPLNALWAILGANLGNTILTVTTTLPAGPIGRRGPTFNGLFRTGFIVITALLLALLPELSRFFTTLADSAIYFHLTFNAFCGLLGLFVINPLSRLAEHYLPTPVDKLPIPQAAQKLFSPENFITPAVSLRVARREIVQNAWNLKYFWDRSTALLERNPEVGAILTMLDQLHSIFRNCETISLFLSRVINEPMTRDEAIAWQNLKTVNGSLKIALTVTERVVEVLRDQKCTQHKSFSPEGVRELLIYHERVARCFACLCTILETENEDERKKLEKQLKDMRNDALKAGLTLTQRHMERVATGVVSAVETSALHLELQSLFNRLCGTIYTSIRVELDTHDYPGYLANKEET